MKVKELKRTVNVAWSPAEMHPACLAAGAAAQQVDASFSSNASLDIYGLNFEHPGTDLELKCSLQTQHKFQKIVWSGAGIIVGGCDGGLLQFYSAEQLLNKAPDALLGSSNKHNGHVSALDINPYQKNLLASGASDSEIFIWDLNNTAQPMAPGNRSQPLDHVQGVAWNHQVQHILGSTFATRCVVWDLRKNEPIMKLSDSQSRTRWRSLAWHPSVATQLCIGSEDDQGPVIQLWDLRLAASPLVTLEGHQKGVMALSWCRQDPDLLLSAGKDGRVLCWNPNNTQPGGELLLEVSQQQQWVFDVAWSPRLAGVLVASCFDQEVAVHSLLGGSVPDSTQHSQSNIMDSFGGVDSFSQLPAVQRAPSARAAPAARPQPPRPPRWLKRPAAAKFAFGGKLVSFERCPQEAGSQKLVHISQVVSEPEIVERALSLDAVLGSSLSQDPGATERLAEYCRQRGDEATEQSERYTWYFLRANFMPTFRAEVLSLLGFKQEDGPKSKSAGDGTTQDAMLSRGESTETEAELSTDTSTDLSEAHTLIEKKLASMDLGSADNNVVIPNGDDSTSAICRALVCGQLERAVEQCLGAGRAADALIIASLGSQELLFKVQQYHLAQSRSDPVCLIAHSLLRGEWDALVRAGGAGAGGGGWRAVLAALVTHTDGAALQHYAEMLGDKLSQEAEPSLQEAATVCYLCGMSPDALVARWAERRGGGAGGGAGGRDAAELARLTELALLVRRAALARGRQLQSLGKLESVLVEYSARLAAQGCLHSALNALEGVAGGRAALCERLQRALGLQQQQQQQQQPCAAPQYGPAGGRTRTVSGHSAKRGHVLAHNDVSHTYSAVPAYEPAAGPPQPPQPSPWGNSSVAAAAPPPPHAPQPARPPSAGPAGGLTSRSKYKVDPSVQSAPLYSQYSYNQASYNPPPGVGGAGGYNSPLPDPYGASSVPAPGFAPVNPIAGNPTYNPPVNPSAINPATLAPSTNGGYYGGAPPEPAPPAPARPVPPGWNDPPILASSKAKPKQEVQAQAPITHPLFGVEPPQHIPLNPAQQYPGQQYPGQQYPDQQQYGQQQYPAQQYGGQQYPGQQQYQGQFTPAYPPQAESPAPAPMPMPTAVAEPLPKPPLPDEHLVLQTVLDALRADCAERASNPQMKRKLEDVQKRLDTLYDMLREYRLSESALSQLHSCVQCARAGEWERAAHAATALATGADFAQAASFLPGLKVLLQLAQQLHVSAR